MSVTFMKCIESTDFEHLSVEIAGVLPHKIVVGHVVH
jgi:hypothetical protein